MMKVPIILIVTGSLVLLGRVLSQLPLSQSLSTLIPVIAMNRSSTALCHSAPVQSSLRIWLDPIPANPAGSPASSGALPPGVTPPAPQFRGTETHILHLELTLVNASQNPQAAQVLGWSWSQGNQTDLVNWNVQPDLSPLNRYSQIQQQRVKLQDRRTVTAVVNLDINGQSCQLQVQVRP